MSYKILHVPKTGGTVIKNSLIDNYKIHKNRVQFLPTKINNLYIGNHNSTLDSKDNFIFFLRDPIKRFISLLIFQQKHGQGYDTDNYFNPTKPFFIKENDINTVISNIYKHNFKQGGIDKNFNIVLGGINNVKKCEKNIFFVGRMEHLEEDFHKMQDKLGIEKHFQLDNSYNNKRPKKFDNLTKITEENKETLRDFLDKDYEIIKYLCEKGFVDKSYLDEINY